MDAQSFDDLTRLIGSGASRRRLLGAFGSSLITLISTKMPARAGCLGIGGFGCSGPTDCCSPFLCTYGYCNDATCVPQGSICTSDPLEPGELTCCFGNSCVDSTCVPEVFCSDPGGPCDDEFFSCCDNLPCVNGFCTDPDNLCTPTGQPCDDATPPCCQDQVCTDGVCLLAVCSWEGEPCTADSDCCESLDGYGCDGGICQDRCTGFDCNCCPGSWCVAEGFECASIECEDDGDCPLRAVGCHNGWCVDYEWWVCEITSDCDPGLECRNGFCSSPCAAVGETCGESVPCCGDLVCSSEDTCIEECRAEGESPCSGSGSYPCCQGLECAEDVCISASQCAVEGDACATADECCGDLVCTSGLCQVAGDSGEPPDDDEVTQLPDTGAGIEESGRHARWSLGSLAAGAAALLAGKTLRKGRDEVGQTGDEAS